MPFDPANLTSSASLNRVRIVDLPGLVPEPDVRGRTGFELLGAQALATAIRERAAALGLDPASDPITLLPAFDHCLGSRRPTIRATANALARCFGRALGYLLLTLRRGDPVNQLARDDWDDSYWAHWAGMSTIWLGGGIASGRLGSYLREHAAAVLEAHGGAAPTVKRADHPAALPLIGAARSLPASPSARSSPPTEAAIVLDFGSTAIKRAYAEYTRGAVAALRFLPPLPTAQLRLGVHTDRVSATAAAQNLAEQMADVIAATWRATTGPDLHLAPHIVVSLANYVRDGHPLPAPAGMYLDLCALPRPAACCLSRLLADRIGREVAITLLHDGSAAARTYAGVSHAAVITLGTALGVGFPPPSVGALRPLAPGFAVGALG